MHSHIANLVLQSTSPIKAVIFDCDGTLVDSEPSHYQGWRDALKKYGIEFSLEEYYPYIGKSTEAIADLLAEKIGKNCAAQLLREKREIYQNLRKKGLPSVLPTLSFVHRLGGAKEELDILLGVASAAKKVDILNHLEHLGIGHYFDLVISGQNDLDSYNDPTGTNKPKPYIYLHIAKLFEILPSEIAVFEDSSAGIDAAVDAGCIAIAVPNAFTQYQDLSRAHLRFDSLKELTIDDFFKHLNPI